MRQGIGAIRQQQLQQEQLKKLGESIKADSIKELDEQLQQFKTHLEDFARRHHRALKTDPHFRSRFQEMCSAIGIDPISSSRGFWTDLLGMGDFYYNLGVEVVAACNNLQSTTGGLVAIDELVSLLLPRYQRSGNTICADDIERAIKSLKCLGAEYSIVIVGSKKMVQSVPRELDTDLLVFLGRLSPSTSSEQPVPGVWTGKTPDELAAALAWPIERVLRAAESALQMGLVWIDQEAPHEAVRYFLPRDLQ
ncbi:hypothetical protein, variant [Fonticula alba]|uniref:Vacuolar-sorting protein SNF8 n=1 Tax=Fonticula alba TaxID=691883 RepID=A0A058Z1B3_FONAL|nr:hypothetical protein, variant [Fonticula alba]KCV68054.1 hypothetical protein, variant [Fonticula alba]|eukprot:XP_009497621.1 hypothetical protein, variant [Fonticula alba]